MAHINDYSQDALARRTGKEVTSWYTVERSYGVTEVHYELLDRHQGMNGGGTIGCIINLTTTFGLVAATVVNPAFAPLLAINSTGGAVGTVLTGMGIGYAVGTNDKHCKWFSTETGEHLGDTDNEIAKTARSKGEELLRECEFAKAKQWFKIAYRASGENEYRQAMRAAEEAELAANCCRESRLKEMREHFQRARELAPSNLKHNFLFAETMMIWNLAWEKEEQAETQEAANLRQNAQRTCNCAAEMCPTNKEYQNWAHVISLKIDGDVLFNEGYSWQDRANQAYRQELYEEALRCYNLALEKYTEGLRKSRDQRFQDCVDIVQRQISTTRQAIDYIHAVSAATSTQRHQVFVR